MTWGNRLIRGSTTVVAVGIAGVAAVVSYQHAYEVVTSYGEPATTAALVPLCVDGLVFAAGMVHLDNARRGRKAGWLAWLGLGLGIGATIAVNILHGLESGPVGAVVAAWPAVTLVLTVELLMAMIRDAARDTKGDTSRDTERDKEGDTQRDTSRDTERDKEGDKTATARGAASRRSRRSSRPVSRDTRRDTDEDRLARARDVLREEPNISGAELGRRLGLSPRQGQRLLADVRAADATPTPGQMAIDDDSAQGDTAGNDVVRLSVVGGER